MSGGWKKIFEKLNSSGSGQPTDADWAAMKASIESHPELKATSGFFANPWKWGIGLLLISTVGLLSWYFYTASFFMTVPNEVDTENQVDQTVISTPQSDQNERNEKVLKESRSAFRLNNNPLGNESDNNSSQADPDKLADSKNIIQGTHQVSSEASHTIFTSRPSTDRDAEPKDEWALGRPEQRESNQTEKTDFAEVDLTDYPLYPTQESLFLSHNSPDFTSGAYQTEFQLDDGLNSDIARISIDKKAEGRASNLKLEGISLGYEYQLLMNAQDRAQGVLLEADFSFGRWLVNTGVHYSQLSRNYTLPSMSQYYSFDSLATSTYDTTITVIVDSVWIINGPNMGGWVDNSRTETHIDSTIQTQIDSTLHESSFKNKVRVRYSMIEIPLMAGYRWRFNRMAFDLYGGISVSKLQASTSENVVMTEEYGLGLIIQPAIRYYLAPRISVFGRTGFRYELLDMNIRPRSFYPQLQLGVAHHF